jgi:hypothetical protein
VPSFSPESISKLQSIKEGMKTPVVYSDEDIKEFAASLETESAEPSPRGTLYESGGAMVSKEGVTDMRMQGGTFEYIKYFAGTSVTRKDVSCETEGSVLKEVNKILQTYHPSLKKLNIPRDLKWDNPEKRIRLPNFGIELKLSIDTSGNPKYNILLGGKYIGELLYHPRGHRHLRNDANAVSPHYNIILGNHPIYGTLHGHLTFNN